MLAYKKGGPYKRGKYVFVILCENVFHYYSLIKDTYKNFGIPFFIIIESQYR